jgi:hypothetical protein
MYYGINESLSREENLKLAEVYDTKAKELLARFDAIVKEANKEFPGRTFGLSKSKLAKHQSPNEAYSRVVNAARTLNHVRGIYATRERLEKEKQEKEANLARLKEAEQIVSNLANEAIAYCIVNGKIFGACGFTIENAISIANDIAFQKEVERQEAEIGDEYIDFSGQNCDDPCEGWNPQHHRCQCGNRRVSWSEGYECNFKDMTIYAEAY